jgi:hypothetical protein
MSLDLPISRRRDYLQFDAARSLPVEISFSDDGRVLFTSGVICDSITQRRGPARRFWPSILQWLTSILSSDVPEDPTFDDWHTLFLPIDDNRPRHPTGLLLPQVFFRTIFRDKSGYGYGRREFEDFTTEND